MRIGHRIAGIATAFWLLECASVLAQQRPASGERFSVGGRQLWLSCEGTGHPAVLLEAGHNETSDTWSEIQSRVAAFTRVCSYDRAGLGRSEPRSGGQLTEGRDVIADLHGLLTAADEAAPFVLVGHSLGAAFVRLYAASNPTATAGLVLVDAAHEREFEAIDQLLTPAQRLAGASMRPLSPEGIDIEGVFADVRKSRSRLEVPVVVVSRGRPLQRDEMPGNWSSEQRRLREEVRKSLQADLATLSTKGEVMVAGRSAHFVHRDEPDVVVTAIRKVVDTWRAERARR